MNEFPILIFVLHTLAFLVNVLIFFQDLKERLVSIWTFPVLFFCFLLSALIQNNGLSEVFPVITGNLLFLSIQFVLVNFYFFIKKKTFVSLINRYIGWGDVFFFLAITPLFSNILFILAYISGLIFSLFLVLLWNIIFQKTEKIPLAGLLALYINILILFFWIIPDFDIFNYQNNWLHNILLNYGNGY